MVIYEKLSQNIKNSKFKIIIVNLAIIFFVILFSIGFEVLIMNRDYWKISAQEKGLHTITESNITMSNIAIDGNKITVLSENNYIKVQDETFIRYLNVSFLGNDYSTIAFSVNNNENIDTVSKQYSGFYEKFVSVKTNANASDSYYHLKSINNVYPITFEIKEISIDNSLYPNIMRILLISTILLLAYYLIIFRKIAFRKMHVTFFIVSVMMGSVFTLFTPYGYSWDEKEHFYKAFNVAAGNVDVIDNPEVEIIGNINEFSMAESSTFRQKVAQLEMFSDNSNNTSKYLNATAKGYTSIAYLGLATGIFIGQKLGLPFIYVFYFGRFFSLLFYSLIGYFAVKNIKIGKNIVFTILLLPPSLFLASTYTADTLTTSMAVLSITFFVNILYEEKNTVTWKKIMPFIIAVILLTACKPTYAPFIILIFAIPKNKFKNFKFHILKKVLFIGCIMFLGLFLYLYTDRFHEIVWPIPGTNSIEQLKYVLFNPIEYIFNFFKYLLLNATYYIHCTVTNIAYVGEISEIWKLIIPSMLIVIALIDEELKVTLNYCTRITMIFVFLFSAGLIYTALYLSYTPVASPFADGVQPRYFIPLYFLLFLCLKNNKIKLNKMEKTKISINMIATIVMLTSLIDLAVYMLTKYYL